MIELNSTLFIQLLNFFITLIILNYLLITPIRGIILQRKNTITKTTEEIENITQKIKKLHLTYEEIIAKTQEEGKIYYKEIELKLNKTKEQRLNAAHHEAQKILKETQLLLINESNAVQQKFKNSMTDFSTLIVKKILM